MLMNRRPNLRFLHQMVSDCYHFSFDQETVIVGEKGENEEKDMAEICINAVCQPSSSIPPPTSGRPFKLLVKNQVFTVDSEKLRQYSPIFALMCFGRDFENGQELIREVVDENSDDIAIFLHCVHDYSLISDRNFPTLLRLANKYQVSSLADACGEYVLKTGLESVKPDQVLTMLIAANDYHQQIAVIKHLIQRLAKEEKTVFTRLKVNRFLPAHLYTSLISANLNLGYIKEIEGMNGHLFRVDQNRTIFKKTLCAYCKKIVEAAECEGCKQSLCKSHIPVFKCSSEYGNKMLDQLKQNIVELNIED